MTEALSGELSKVLPGTYKATVSQFFGMMLDAFDLVLVLAMASILGAVFLPGKSHLLDIFAIILSYTITLIFRPVGSAIFGNLADKLGRKKTLIITMVGIGLFAAMPGVLPTYAVAGYLAFALYSILRAVVGIFAGGEYAAGHPFAMEWSPPNKRGLISGLVQGGFSIGAFLAGLLISVFVGTFGAQAVILTYWRYIFIFPLVILIVGLIIRLTMDETPVFQSVERKKQVEKFPLASLFRGDVRRDFFQVMLMMTGMFFFAYALFAYVPAILEFEKNPPLGAGAYYISAFTNVSAFIAAVAVGAFSQRSGRKKMAIAWCVMSFVLAIPLYYLLYEGAIYGNFVLALIAGLLIGAVTQGIWGMVPVYLSERFRTSHRGSGVGFGYSSGIFIGGWFSIYVPLMHTYLFSSIDTATNIWFSTAVLLMIGAVIVGVGYMIGPETVGSSLSEEGKLVTPAGAE
ncbi:MAG: MFS transporter [Thermoplasmatales archaeon]|nr:MFS transporter [Thermoplasmatales archaeon]